MGHKINGEGFVMCLKGDDKVKLPCAFGCGRTIDTDKKPQEYRGVGVFREAGYVCPMCGRISWVSVGKTKTTV